MPRTLAALVLLLGLAVFLGVAGNGFVNLDDGLYITENPMVARGLSATGILWAFTNNRTGNWHPLTWISHMLDVDLFGMSAGWHHAMSLALHAGSTLLLYSTLYALTGALWRSLFVAALFAVHPMRVESVAWASERKDVLAMLFTLLALRAYLGWLRRPGPGCRLALVGCFTLALLAKPMPVAFPFLLLLLDWWPLGRWAPQRGPASGTWALLPPRALWREKVPLFLLSAIFSVVASITQAAAGGVTPIWRVPLPSRAANAVQSYVAYLAATLWPRDLAVFYPHPYVLPPWPTWCACVLLLTVATVMVWRTRRRSPWLPVGWFWYLGALLPMIGIVQVGMQARADRYTYLPQIGIFVMAVWGFAEVRGRPRIGRLLPAAGIAAVLLSAAVTVGQVSTWRSSVSLQTRARDVAMRQQRDSQAPGSPALAFIHNGLGQAYYDVGRLDEAIAEFRSALALNPAFPAPKYNLARALEGKGAEAEANALYVQALAPDFPEPWNNLGAMLARRGQREEGMRLFEKAIAIDPLYVEPRNNLGSVLMELGRLEEAVRIFEQAIAIDASHVALHSNLGATLGMAGRPVAAERELRAAVALDPGYEPARFNLGKLLLELGRYAEAVDQLRESLRLQPHQGPAAMLLAEAYSRAGQPAEAERVYRQAHEIEPALREIEEAHSGAARPGAAAR